VEAGLDAVRHVAVPHPALASQAILDTSWLVDQIFILDLSRYLGVLMPHSTNNFFLGSTKKWRDQFSLLLQQYPKIGSKNTFD
jgi:hypothetical protein